MSHVLLLVPATMGLALLLDTQAWVRRRSLGARLRGHRPTLTRPSTRRAGGTGVGDLMRAPAEKAVEALGRAVGITEPLQARLRRAGSSWTPAEFRLRQLRQVVTAAAGGAVLAAALRNHPTVATVALLGAPLLAALAAEQRLAALAAVRRHRIRLELPVVAEQLALLIGAGRSLPAALRRVAERGRGEIASDLAGVVRRVRHGLDEVDALKEWASATSVEGVDRLVAVLALHREATDLGALIAQEARSARLDAHRELIESIERRAQLVWVPVTVATLVPGLLFLAVPFVAALSGVTGA